MHGVDGWSSRRGRYGTRGNACVCWNGLANRSVVLGERDLILCPLPLVLLSLLGGHLRKHRRIWSLLLRLRLLLLLLLLRCLLRNRRGLRRRLRILRWVGSILRLWWSVMMVRLLLLLLVRVALVWLLRTGISICRLRLLLWWTSVALERFVEHLVIRLFRDGEFVVQRAQLDLLLVVLFDELYDFRTERHRPLVQLEQLFVLCRVLVRALHRAHHVEQAVDRGRLRKDLRLHLCL